MSRAPEAELVSVAGREVAISNPGKVLFPKPGYTKRDLVRYYVSVAEGALRAAGDRPNVLVRYPNGIDQDFFYQKRAPTSRPDWIDVVSLQFPSGRTAEEVVPRDAAALAWMANLACLELHPHPVRADDLDHPDELRVDLDPVPGVGWDQIREVAHVVRATLEDLGWWAGRRRPARAACTCTCASNGGGDSTRCGAPRWRWRARWSAAPRPWPPASGGRRSGTGCSWTTTRTPRTAPWPQPIPFGPRPMRACRRRCRGTRSTRRAGGLHPGDHAARFAEVGDRHAGIDAAPCSLDALLELSARHERDGLGDAPWPPHYRKQAGEPPRVQPSKRRTPGSAGAARGRRRRSSKPRVEIARARSREDALAGLERWKARHPDAAGTCRPPTSSSTPCAGASARGRASA
jgi:bifunctional non-homologous end joining protein LigD